MTKREVRQLFPAKNWQLSSDLAHERLQKRNWTVDNNDAILSGITSQGQSIFACFSVIKSVESGASWDRYQFPLDVALDCISGNLTF